MENNKNSRDYYASTGLNNYVEYLTEQKGGAGLLLRRVLIVLLVTALLVAGTVVFTYVVTIPQMMIAVFLICFVIMWYLWKFTQIEYEYVIASGIIEVDRIFGKNSRRKMCEFPLSQVQTIAPHNAKNAHLIQSSGAAKTYFAASSMKSDNLYFVIFSDGKAGKGVLYIDIPEKCLSILKYYNKGAVVE